jgi:hypothetical protein
MLVTANNVSVQSVTTVTAGKEEALKLTVLPAEAPIPTDTPAATVTTTVAATAKPVAATVELTEIASPTSEPVPTATPFPVVITSPTGLTIASIGLVDSPIQAVGMEKIKTSSGETVLRWQARDKGVGYQPTTEGEICHWGLVTLNGHNWFQLKPAIFINLYKVKPGETLSVTSSGGETCDYQVEWMKQYGPQETSWLYQSDLDPNFTYLNIYTCSTNFQERFVVRARRPKS